jgi:hypothetical protein
VAESGHGPIAGRLGKEKEQRHPHDLDDGQRSQPGVEGDRGRYVHAERTQEDLHATHDNKHPYA